MRSCDSVIQNPCRMQGRCVFGGIRSTACLGEGNHLYSIPKDLKILKLQPGMDIRIKFCA